MEKAKKIKIILGITYLLLISAFLFVFFNKFSLNELTSYEFIKNNRDHLINLRNENYLITIITFFFGVVLWVMLLGFGSPVALLSGFIFGKWLGTLIVTISLSIGALIVYITTKFFFRDLIKNKFPKKMYFLKNLFKKNEFFYFLIYRFIGGIPFAIANTIPAIFNVKNKNYFFGTLIGMTPQLFIFVSLGSGIEKIINENSTSPSFFEMLLSKQIYLPIIAFIIFIIIGFFLRKKFYKKKYGALDENLTHD